jgi:RND family efflux transporter MFP subunit
LEELKTEELNLKVKAREIKVAESNARSSSVSLQTAQRRLSETKIYSPINGVVTARFGQIGNIVASGINNVGGGTTIMTVADLSKIFTLAAIDESDIGRVELGQKVKITADGFPGETFEGIVVQVASKGINTANVITFDVKIEVIDENAHQLKPEMTTNIEIIIDKKDNALYIPLEAIARKGKKTTVQVITKEYEKPETRFVKTGMNNGTIIEILKGLKEGEKVIVNKSQLNSRWKKDKSSANQSGSQSASQSMSRGMMMSGRGMGR